MERKFADHCCAFPSSALRARSASSASIRSSTSLARSAEFLCVSARIGKRRRPTSSYTETMRKAPTGGTRQHLAAAIDFIDANLEEKLTLQNQLDTYKTIQGTSKIFHENLIIIFV